MPIFRNSFGNLAQRSLSFIAKNLDGVLPKVGRQDAVDGQLEGQISISCRDFISEFNAPNLNQAIESWMQAVFACNQYIDAQAPWALRKTDPDRMHAVLGTLVRAIRDLAIIIIPVIPDSAGRVLDQLGAVARDHAAIDNSDWYDALAATDFRVAPPSPVFPRLDMPAEVAA